MLIKTLRNVLKNKTIARTCKKSQNETYDADYMRQIIAGHKSRSALEGIEYEVAGQVLFELKERHDNYIKENFPVHDVNEEWSIFLDNNTK